MSLLDIALTASVPVGAVVVAITWRFTYKRSKLKRQRKLKS